MVNKHEKLTESLREPRSATNYSNDIWDYIDVLPYMPSREDRDALLKQAHLNPEKQIHLTLWDYFFRIKPDDIGINQQYEIDLWIIKRDRDVQQRRDADREALRIELLTREQLAYETWRNKRRQEWLTLLLSGVLAVILGSGSLLLNGVRTDDVAAMAAASLLLIFVTLLGYALLRRYANLDLAQVKKLSDSFRLQSWSGFLSVLGIFITLASIVPIILFGEIARGALLLFAIIALIVYAITISEAMRSDRVLSESLQKLAEERRIRNEGIESDFQRRVRYIDSEIARLQQQIDTLKRQIPKHTTDNEVAAWLEKEIQRLRGIAKQRMNFQDADKAIDKTRVLLKLDDGPTNPLLIQTPTKFLKLNFPVQFATAYSDENTRRNIDPEVEEKLWNQRESDGEKHKIVYRDALLPDGSPETFFGMYSLEFVLIAEDLLGIYSCIYDFITGRVIQEKTSEQFYKDVVAIAASRDYRIVELRGQRTPIANALTFNITLSSGDGQELKFARSDFIEGVKNLLGRTAVSDLPIWVKQSEAATNIAERILRERIRLHKERDGNSSLHNGKN